MARAKAIYEHALGVSILEASTAASATPSLPPSVPKLSALQAAAIAAPILRGARKHRRITTLDADGNPVRVVSSVELARAQLVRQGIEFDVPGAPWWTCDSCGEMFERGKGKGSTLKHTACASCRACRCVSCGVELARTANTPSQASRRKGPARCKLCAYAARRRTPPACQCGRPLAKSSTSPSRASGRNDPWRCRTCARRKRVQTPALSACACGKPLTAGVMRADRVAARSGRPPCCKSCAAVRRHADREQRGSD